MSQDCDAHDVLGQACDSIVLTHILLVNEYRETTIAGGSRPS
jgi:hypothetical protein